MIVIRQFICTVFLPYLVCTSLTGQSVIQGLITNEEAQPIDACIVFLVHKNSMLLTDHTLTDEDGQYHVTAPKPGDYIIEINNLAYWDTAFHIKVEEQSIITTNITLKVKAYDLLAVEIVDQLLGIRRDGDSLFYNIHAYTDGSEMLVEDLLRKLPGIDVSAEGKVSYMGKTIDALLLDGNDLTGNRHFQITQNFQSDIIDGIQIIENYIGEFDSRSIDGGLEKIAMNIELKKDKKGSTVGNLAGGIGYRKRYTGKINALRSNPRQGYSFFSGSSNHERDRQAEDLPTTYPQNWNYIIGTQRFTFIDYDLYSDHYPEGQFVDHFIQMTETNRMDDHWTRRTYLRLAGGHSEAQTEISKFRFADQTNEESLIFKTKNRFSIHLDHDTKIQVSPKWKIITKVDCGVIVPRLVFSDTGMVESLPYSLESNTDKKFLQLNVEGLAEWSFHDRHTLKFLANYKHFSGSSSWDMISDEHLFNYSTINSSGKHSINYFDQYQQNFQVFGAEWIWTPEVVNFIFFGKQTILKENVKVHFKNSSFEDEADYNIPMYETGFKAMAKINDLKITGDITLVRSGNDDRGIISQYWILPSLKLRQDLGKLNVVSVLVQRQVRLPGLLYFHGLPILFDQRTLIPFSLMPQQHISTWNASVFLQKKPGSYKNSFIANLSGSWADKTLVTKENMDEDHFLRSVGVFPSNSIYRIMLLGWHTTNKWNLNYNHVSVLTSGHSVLGDQNVRQENLLTRTMIELSFKGLKNYEFSISPIIQFQQQTIGEIVTEWINPIFYFSMRHKGSNWEYSFDLSQNVNQSQNQSLRVQTLNFSIGFRKWMPFRIIIEGNDILNLTSNQSLTAIINPTFTQSILSERMPGSILLIGRYDF